MNLLYKRCKESMACTCKLHYISYYIIVYLYMLVRHSCEYSSNPLIRVFESIRTSRHPSIRASWLLNGILPWSVPTHLVSDMTSSGQGPRLNTVYCKLCTLLICINIIKTTFTLFISKTSKYTLENLWYTWFNIIFNLAIVRFRLFIQ